MSKIMEIKRIKTLPEGCSDVLHTQTERGKECLPIMTYREYTGETFLVAYSEIEKTMYIRKSLCWISNEEIKCQENQI